VGAAPGTPGTGTVAGMPACSLTVVRLGEPTDSPGRRGPACAAAGSRREPGK
jgi:hypothetical protein